MTTHVFGRGSRHRRSRRAVALGALSAGALVLSGCGSIIEGMLGDDDDVEDIFEDLEDVEDADDTTDDAIDADKAIDEGSGGVEEVSVMGRSIDATVHYSGLEYTIGQMTVTDHDEGQDMRIRGLTLDFDVSVSNDWSDSQMPNVPIALQWDEEGTGHVVEVNGQADLRQVPAGASASGAFSVNIGVDDLDTYNDQTARLLLGRSGQAQAQVPVGPQAELVTLFPVAQDHLVGEVLETGPVPIIIESAHVQWNLGNSNAGQVENGTVLFEMGLTMDNTSEHQVCLSRGQGSNFSLVAAGGEGYVDMGVSDRCASGGQAIDVWTGLTIDEDYAGNYTLSTDLTVMVDPYDAELDIELIAGDGGPVGGSDAADDDDAEAEES